MTWAELTAAITIVVPVAATAATTPTTIAIVPVAPTATVIIVPTAPTTTGQVIDVLYFWEVEGNWAITSGWQ